MNDNDQAQSALSERRRALKLMGGAALAAGAMGLPGAVFAQGGKKLKIGFVTPKTGPLAPFAEADNFVIEQMRKLFDAGIDVGGVKYPVEIIVKDSQSNPNRAAGVATDLIVKDRIDLMLVSSTPETTNPVSDQCELNRKPCISTVAPWQPWFFTRGGKPEKGFDWTYHFFWGLEDLIAVFNSMWAGAGTNKVVGALWPNDGDGNAWGDAKLGFPPVLKKDGYTVVDPGRYQNLTADYSAQIARYKEANVQILTGVPIPPDFTTFWNQAMQKGFRPKVATVGKALLFPASVEALGDNGDGLSSEVWWTPHHPFKSSLTGQSAAQLADAYEAAVKKQWTQPLGFAHALFEIAVDVLRRAKDLDSAASIRDAIAATRLDTIVGPVSWQGGPVKNVAKTPLVGGQWRKGGKHKYQLVIVDNSQATMIPVQDKLKPIGL
ncbi:ABC transporter substrate-binding protein [Thauera sinica]|uniref:ABC transporter substrate-binding protein n=1 Tax=Thauera sinica TaxID=2665146 RepID=A0ABW1AMV0_9RHOO|nr:ABC transporter substrate-binding protein [Thauera sp. K11]ATE61655.1 ABC transporter substrate-binding protein [Thauera sp. K11]